MGLLRVEERKSGQLDDEVVDSSRFQRVGDRLRDEDCNRNGDDVG